MTSRNLPAALVFCAISLATAATALEAAPPETDPDWRAVLALDAGPGQPIRSREEAHNLGLAHLAKQEAALRAYLAEHPRGGHAVDAILRLAHLFSTRSDLTGKSEHYRAAVELLENAEKTTPAARQADIAFAKIALAMHRMPIPTDTDRVQLTARMRAFQQRFPEDRRLAPLIAEVANLYDEQPRHKATLLKQAFEAARDEELRSRIQDDLRRLEVLGRSVAVQGTTTGGSVNTLDSKGKVVLVYFFARFSPPSVAALREVAYLKKTFPPEQLDVFGVNLDAKKETIEELMKAQGIDWPVLWDGHGWEGPLVRSLAINALPTLWILDKQGILRTLNARTESEALVRVLLKEKP